MDQDERHKSDVEKLNVMFNGVFQVRNALCHGQINASGNPSENKAFAKTELSGIKADYHYFDLIATFDKIHCIQMVFMDISLLYTDLNNHSVDTVFKNIQGRFERVDNMQ